MILVYGLDRGIVKDAIEAELIGPMDAWLTGIVGDKSNAPMRDKLARHKPRTRPTAAGARPSASWSRPAPTATGAATSSTRCTAMRAKWPAHR